MGSFFNRFFPVKYATGQSKEKKKWEMIQKWSQRLHGRHHAILRETRCFRLGLSHSNKLSTS